MIEDPTISLARIAPAEATGANGEYLGHAAVGLEGLLVLVEQRLGLPGLRPTPASRLVQYLACVDRAAEPAAFYFRSYQADPFATARALLAWRDAWYVAGWDGGFDTDAPRRLIDMASIERHARHAVAAGVGERLSRVIEHLRGRSARIGGIRLLDPLEHFPGRWRTLIETLGAPLAAPTAAPARAAPDTDLGRLQRHLLAGREGAPEFRDDGSLLLLEADSPSQSAAVVANRARQQLESGGPGRIAILAENRGDLVDDALESCGAPRLGFRQPSPWRPLFQVLPLALELLWEPPDPRALYQFLSHPVGPLRGRHRRRLARVVAERPGIDGPDWQRAVADCLADEPGDAGQAAARLDLWLKPSRHDPGDGIDAALLQERARAVEGWLVARLERAANAEPEGHRVALNQVREFAEAVGRLATHGRPRLSRDHVRRLVEDVRGSGIPLPDREAECAEGHPPLYRADHAGSLVDGVDDLTWWDCAGGDRLARWPWSHAERAALAARHALPESPERQLAWLSDAWRRPLLAATRRLILVRHRDSRVNHPTWDYLLCTLPDAAVRSMHDAVSMDRLALRRRDIEPLQLPPRVRWWKLPAPPTIPPRRESYSSLDLFINSPYRWLLRYPAAIRPGSLQTLSDGGRLRGNLAHRLLEQYFNTHREANARDPERAAAWVDDHVGDLLRTEGALLLLPGRQAERERFIEQLKQGLGELLQHLHKAGADAIDMEVAGNGSFVGGELTGSIDLLARLDRGREAIVDIKWGGARYRADSLRAGDFMQLATYAHLRGAETGAEPLLGYFIVAECRMLSLDHDAFPDADRIVPDAPVSARDFWQRLEFTWRWRRDQLDRGLVEVPVSGTTPDPDSATGAAGLELPETHDAFDDYAALAGWEPGA